MLHHPHSATIFSPARERGSRNGLRTNVPSCRSGSPLPRGTKYIHVMWCNEDLNFARIDSPGLLAATACRLIDRRPNSWQNIHIIVLFEIMEPLMSNDACPFCRCRVAPADPQRHPVADQVCHEACLLRARRDQMAGETVKIIRQCAKSCSCPNLRQSLKEIIEGFEAGVANCRTVTAFGNHIRATCDQVCGVMPCKRQTLCEFARRVAEQLGLPKSPLEHLED